MTDNNWIFVPLMDSIGEDHMYTGSCDLAMATGETVAVNTLGFYKRRVTFPLVSSAYYKSANDGIYIRRSLFSFDEWVAPNFVQLSKIQESWDDKYLLKDAKLE